MRSRNALLAVVLSAMFSCPAFAQQAVVKTPEDAIHAYVADLQETGMQSVSRHIHPEELARFKTLLMPWLRRDAAGNGEALTTLFGPDATLALVEELSDAEFMDAFMRVVGAQIKDATFGKAQILGSIKENDVIHYVTRNEVSVQGIQVKSMEVISLRSSDSGWKLLLSEKLEGLATALAAQP